MANKEGSKVCKVCNGDGWGKRFDSVGNLVQCPVCLGTGKEKAFK